MCRSEGEFDSAPSPIAFTIKISTITPKLPGIEENSIEAKNNRANINRVSPKNS